jgi:hypothetical protein
MAPALGALPIGLALDKDVIVKLTKYTGFTEPDSTFTCGGRRAGGPTPPFHGHAGHGIMADDTDVLAWGLAPNLCDFTFPGTLDVFHTAFSDGR